MVQSHDERTIIAVKLHGKNSPGLGLITPVAEILNDQITPLTAENFCPTGQVFIPSKYDEIDSKFRYGELFKIKVELNTIISEKTNNPCKYKALGNWAEKLPQSEIAEVISAELPDKNDRRLLCATLPSTPYVFIRNAAKECFGLFEWSESSEDQASELTLKFVIGGGLGAAGGTKQIHKVKSKLAESRISKCEIDGQAKFFVNNVGSLLSAGPPHLISICCSRYPFVT